MPKGSRVLERQGHELTEVDFPIEARPLIQSYYRMNAAETVGHVRTLGTGCRTKIDKPRC